MLSRIIGLTVEKSENGDFSTVRPIFPKNRKTAIFQRLDRFMRTKTYVRFLYVFIRFLYVLYTILYVFLRCWERGEGHILGSMGSRELW